MGELVFRLPFMVWVDYKLVDACANDIALKAA